MNVLEFFSKDIIHSTIRLFEHITDSLDLKVEKEVIQTIVRNPSHLLPEKISYDELLEHLESIAQELDIRLVKIANRNYGVLKTASPKTPVYTIGKDKTWLSIQSMDSEEIDFVDLAKEKSFSESNNSFKSKHLGLNENDRVVWLAPEPMYPLTKKKYSKYSSILSLLYYFLKPEMKDIWIIVVYSFGIGIFSLVVPVAISSIINTVAFGTLLQPIVILTLAVLFFLSLAGFLNILQSYIVEFLQRRLFIRIVNELTQKILNIDRSKFQKEYLPELVSRYFEIFTLQKNATVLLMDGLALILITIVGLIIISVYHPFFLIYSIFLLVLIYVLILIKIPEGSELAIKVSKQKFKLYHWIIDITDNITLFRNNKTAGMGMEKIDFLSRDYLYTRDKEFLIKVKQHIGGIIIQGLGHALLLGLGGYLVIERHLTLGQLVASELIISKVLDSFSGINKYIDTYYGLVASIDKVSQMLDIPVRSQKTETMPIDNNAKKIEIKNLKLSETGTKFSNINFTFEPGKIYTIYSHSPDLVSNLLDTIVGEAPIESGMVLIDNKDITFLEKNSLSESILLIRDIEIFHGTILDNIRCGKYDVTLGDIYSALDKTGLISDLAKFKDSIVTELSSLGYPLRPHQLRLLMVSRTFCHTGGLLILDDILDEIDTQNLTKIIESYKNDSGKNTIIIHTERREVIEQFDNLLVFDHTGLKQTKLSELS